MESSVSAEYPALSQASSMKESYALKVAVVDSLWRSFLT